MQCSMTLDIIRKYYQIVEIGSQIKPDCWGKLLWCEFYGAQLGVDLVVVIVVVRMLM